MTLHPAVALCRRGVRGALRGLEPGDAVLVACSGGADSLALASAAVFEGRRLGLRVIGATVDHGLQPGSAQQARRVVAQLTDLGVAETVTVRVTVRASGDGPEAAARRARYDALEEVRSRHGAAVVLLGHTLDDQAETVLLGLARGSGIRSLAGMRRSYDTYARPLLDVTREQTVTACEVEGLVAWSDPHNDDLGLTRVRVRHAVLPVLEDNLGPGVAAALARTADLAREDAEALDGWARTVYDQVASTGSSTEETSLGLADLDQAPRAVVSRVVRLAALRAGATDSELFHVHVCALLDLVSGRVSGEVQLPGRVTAYRARGRLRFRGTPMRS